MLSYMAIGFGEPREKVRSMMVEVRVVPTKNWNKAVTNVYRK